jgi:hypothetical protein
MNKSAKVSWEPQPAGAAWIQRQVARFRELNPVVDQFERLLGKKTGTRLVDWIDHLLVTDTDGLTESGFVESPDGWYEHPGALLPAVSPARVDRMLLRVDSVSDFALAQRQRWNVRLTGEPLDLLRCGSIEAPDARAEFGVIEHRGCNARHPERGLSDREKISIQKIREQLRLRRRESPGQFEAFQEIRMLIESSIKLLGRDLTCDLFFEAERDYWLSRNRAAQVQLMRQSALGLGWGNHDHHTYRSSRSCFAQLIELFELLGFECRERFYAGREAGWGAQVLEQPVCRVVIFADVDLSPDEITDDFSHQPLSPRQELGTIGLWCALHGEAVFEAGMHHLECQFDFDGARTQLEELGIRSMKPFTDFPFLRQCFTEGEQWAVDPKRIESLRQNARITDEQANRFLREGAVGSHLEILERNDGYRGFNQTGINDIIRKTDPRFLTTNASH